MKKVTSYTIFDDSVGKRISLTYSEIDDNGTIVTDNKRIDRVITDSAIIAKANEIAAFAQTFVDNIDK